MTKFDANITFLFREYPLLQRFEVARSAGFLAVELLITEGISPITLAKAAKEAGIEIVLCNAPMGDFIEGGLGFSAVPGRQQQFHQAIDQVCDMASVLGCSKVHIGPSRVPHEASRDSCFETLVENLIYSADLLGKQGVQILLEPLNKYDTPEIYLHDLEEALRAIRSANCPNVAVQYDIYHQAKMGVDIMDQLQTHMNQIGHIQFADAPGRGMPGSGSINFPAIFAEIDRLGYSGWVGAEYKPSGKTEDSLQWLKLVTEMGAYHG